MFKLAIELDAISEINGVSATTSKLLVITSSR